MLFSFKTTKIVSHITDKSGNIYKLYYYITVITMRFTVKRALKRNNKLTIYLYHIVYNIINVSVLMYTTLRTCNNV